MFVKKKKKGITYHIESFAESFSASIKSLRQDSGGLIRQDVRRNKELSNP